MTSRRDAIAARLDAVITAGKALPADFELKKAVSNYRWLVERLQYEGNPGDLDPILPPSFTAAEAVEAVESARDSIIEATLRDIDARTVDLIKPAWREAVSARAGLNAWPLVAPRESRAAEALHALYEEVPGARVWPAAAAPLDVASWSRRAFTKALGKAEAARVLTVTEILGIMPSWKGWDSIGLALLYLAEREVEAGQKRGAVAIDASRNHRALIAGIRSKGPTPTKVVSNETYRFELLNPGQSVQLTLPGIVHSAGGAIVDALRRMKDGAAMLRHWCALQRLWSIEGGRQGWVRWTLDAHMEAMGVDRRHVDQRARIAAEVEALSKLELVIYNETRTVSVSAPLILVGERWKLHEGAESKLERMELRINDRLYDGVRDSKTGKLGKNWGTIPAELAHVDHVRFPYAHGLGMLFAIESRWDAGDGRRETRISGLKLLERANIKHDKREWKRLEDTLRELVHRGVIQEPEWDGVPWSNAGICVLRPAAWIEDRTVRKLIPAEPYRKADLPLTGAELAAWRKSRGLSIRVAAAVLKVTGVTIQAAEKSGDKPLTDKVRKAVAEAMTGAAV